MKVAQFVYRLATSVRHVAAENSWMVRDPDYSRVSEWVDVSFPDLVSEIPKEERLAKLRETEERARAAHEAELRRLAEQRQILESA